MTDFVLLRSIIRTTLYDLPSSIFLIKSDIEVEPKFKGALRGAYIEICVHLTTWTYLFITTLFTKDFSATI